MKKLLLFIMAVLLGLSSLQLTAQDVVEIPGNGGTTTDSYLPSYCFYNYSLTQQIYTAMEIGTSGSIGSIAFYNTGTDRTRSLNIYMVHTDKTSFSGSSDWITVTDNDLVFSGSVTMTANTWTNIQLTNTFDYNGNDNLAVIVDDNTGSYESSTTYRVFNATSMAIRVYSDGTNYDPLNPTGYSGTVVNVKNQIQLEITSGTVTCPRPNNLTASNVSAHEATLSWSPGDSETSWDLYYTSVQTDVPDSNTTPLATSYDTTYDLTNLAPATLYYTYVRANCGNEYSKWKSGSTFKTQCVDIDSLPYIQNFDNYGTGSDAYVDCWFKLSTYTSNTSPYITATNYQGVGSLYFYAGSSNTYNMAIMPSIDPSIPLNTLQVSFMYRGSANLDRLIVGVIEDISNDATFTPIDTVYPYLASVSTWDERIVKFSGYEGTGTNIAFKNEYTTSSTYAYIDNVVLDVISECQKPVEVIASNYTDEGADIYWTVMGEETSWEIAAVPAGGDPDTCTPVLATSNPHTLTGLLDDTSYDIYVRSVCDGNEYSEWSIKRTFKTNPSCSNPQNVSVGQITTNSAMVIWTDANFGANSYTVGCSEAGQNTWTIQNVTGATECMFAGLSIGTAYDVFVVSNCTVGEADTVFNSFTTRSCLVGGDLEIGDGSTTSSYFPEYATYNYSYTQQIYLASEMNGAADINSITFNVSAVNFPNRHIAIYLMHTTSSSGDTWLNASNAQMVFDTTVTFSTGLNTFYFNTPFQYNGIDNLALIVLDSTGTWSSSNVFVCHTTSTSLSRYIYQDSEPYGVSSTPSNGYTSSSRNDVIFGVPCDSTTTCAAPNTYVTSVTTNSVTVAWVPGNTESSWELEYTLDSVWTSVGSVTSPYTITGLPDNTNVLVRVRAMCGASETSQWAGTSARTRCSGVNTLPITENFDQNDGASGNMLECWTTLTNSTTSYPYLSATYAHSGNYSTYFYGSNTIYSYLISPEIDASISISDLQVSFWAYKTSASYYVQVGAMTDPNDYSTFVQLGGNVSPSENNSWELMEINLDEYTGNGHYIAIRIPQSYTSYMYVDDIIIDIIPTCTHTEDLIVSNVDASNATFDWTPGADENAWDLAIVPGVGVVDFDTVNIISVTGSPSYTANNLEQNTTYTVYVRANCGNEQSMWMNTSFMTSQIPAELPYYCSFEDATEAGLIGIVNGTQPNQWVIGTATSNGGSHALYISNNNGTSNEYTVGSASAVWAYRDIEFPASANGYVFSFDWRCYGESGYDYLRVFIGDPTPVVAGNYNQPAGSTIMTPNVNSSYPTYFNLSSSYQTFSTLLPGFSETTVKRIYFSWRNDPSAGTMPPAAIDNISIDQLFCDAPTALTVSNITSTSAEISWTSDASSSVLSYMADGDPDWTVVDPATSPYTLTNLTATTTYLVRLANNCDDGTNVSPAVSTTFSTSMEAVALPYSTDFDAASGSDVAWIRNNGSCSNYWVFGQNNNEAALFVTTDGNTSGYNTSSASTVSAEKLFTVGTDAEFSISFDVLSGGESSWDYLKVFFAPSDVSFPASTTSPDYAAYSYSQNAVDFSNYLSSTGYTSYPYKLNLTQDNVLHVEVIMPNPNTTPDATSAAKLVFVWKNDASSGTQPGAVIYNVSIAPLTCPKPTGLTVSNVTVNSADLAWTAGSSETQWNVEYKEVGATTWISNTTSTPSYQLTGLSSITTYDVRVQALCSADDSSSYATTTFATNGCDAADMCEYTFILGDSYGDGWNGAYLTVEQNSSVIATLQAVNHNSSSTQTYDTVTVNLCDNISTSLVWHSGSFDDEASIIVLDPNDNVIFSKDSMDTYTTFTFTTNCSGTPGPVITDPTVATNAATAIGQYTATLNATVTNPDNVTITAKGFEWKTTTGGTFTQIAGTGTGNTFTANLNGLTANTGYTYKAFITFNGTTVYGSEMTFTTLPEDTPEPCDVPTGLTTGTITHESIAISWDANPNVSSWNIQYRPVGGTLSSATSTTNSYTIHGLASETQYQIQVQAVCSDGQTSDWSPAVTATTLTGINEHLMNSISLYPNPAKDVVNVQCTMNDVQVKAIEVFDMYGKLLQTVSMTPETTTINVSGLASGMYFVRVTTEEGAVTKSFVKK